MRYFGRDTPTGFPVADAGMTQAHVVVLGAIGGAGASILVRLIGPFAVDAGRTLTRPDGRPLLVVTRSTAPGLLAATHLVAAARDAGHLPPLLAIVGDGPWPAPKQARARRRMLDDRLVTAAVIDVPYVIGWRDLDDPLTTGEIPSAVRHAVQRLTQSATFTTQPTR